MREVKRGGEGWREGGEVCIGLNPLENGNLKGGMLVSSASPSLGLLSPISALPNLYKEKGAMKPG